jgi:capsule polysaccharide export protein KpsE/RkpR
MLLGSAVVTWLPNQYQASSRIYVDTDSLMGPLLKGIAVQADPAQELAVMQATLLRRPNLLKVARLVDADLGAKNEMQVEGVLSNIESHTTVELSGPNLFKITHTNFDPRRAKDVVQAFLNIFVESNLGKDREDIESTRAFIDKQIAGYEAQLQATEKRMADFRAKYADVISSSGTSFSARLEKAHADVKEASSVLADVKNRRDPLPVQSQKASQPSETSSAEDEAKDVTVAKLRAELNQKRAIYSDQHPDIIALKRQIAGLETQNVQSAEQRLAEAKDTLKHLEDMANSAPLLEAQMADMTREYDILKQKYDELRIRGESARISQDAKANTEAMRFRIIEPPEVPVAPSGPKRTLLLIAVLCASIGGGVGIALLLSEMDDSFATPQRLREAFDLQFLGSVCWIPSEADKAKRYFDAMSVSIGAGAMVAFSGLLIALTTHLVGSTIDLRDLTQGLFGAGL